LTFYNFHIRSTIISTHISPIGKCNLNCDYCSVSKRNTFESIFLETFNKYITDIVELGCKAVIFTGGGEPTLHPDFLQMVHFVESKGLEYAIITNGTNLDLLSHLMASWIRISINRKVITNKFLERDYSFYKGCTIGMSLIYADENKNFQPDELIRLADLFDAKYVRLLPDCALTNNELKYQYDVLYNFCHKLNDKRFFVQEKVKKAPSCSICHQSYFRPYLSEINGGTVFPCDSVPLIDNNGLFDMKYALCPADKINDYMSHEIKQPFDARECTGCVFHKNVDLLDHIFNSDSPFTSIECNTDNIIEHINFV
jgi:organic radical activating enzyme